MGMGDCVLNRSSLYSEKAADTRGNSLFIQKIHINKVRHLENVDIVLSENECKHLILTGMNGSGKTSLLEALKETMGQEQSKQTIVESALIWEETDKLTDQPSAFSINSNPDKKIPNFPSGINLQITFEGNREDFDNTVFAYISTSREKIVQPISIEPIRMENKTDIRTNYSKDFLRYMIFLDYQLYGAQADQNEVLETNLTSWFDHFVDALRDIFACKELKIKRETKNLTFRVILPDREPFGINEMADGYAAFLNILTELLMKMETAEGIVDYHQSAIVLIDEIETHLHMEMQKQALPFLTKMFPNTQFIVATHSPFIINSIPDAVVYDLETNTRLEGDLTEYSFSDIVEGYFDVNECAATLQEDFDRYVELCKKEMLTNSEAEERYTLFKRLEHIPKISDIGSAFFLFELKRKAIGNR
jgi:predicted ATPase